MKNKTSKDGHISITLILSHTQKLTINHSPLLILRNDIFASQYNL